MSEKVTSDGMRVVDTLEFGQGDDGAIAEVFKAFNMFREGYYGLLNFGPNWWEVFNQDIVFDRMMEKEWGRLEEAEIMEVLMAMEKAMVGTYVRFDRFAEAVEEASRNGYGYRPKGRANDE